MLLRLNNLSFSHEPGVTLFSDLSLELSAGKIYALLGLNGCGKTTFFNLINGFYKPQSGEIIFDGKEITRLPPFKRNRAGIGRTFQDLRLISRLSARDNVLLAMEDMSSFFSAKNRKAPQIAADRLLSQFSLSECAASPATQLSFGQQKLLSLACCAANGARFLLLDEPIAGISAGHRAAIAASIKALRGQGKTILLIEHDLDFIKAHADRILFMSEGTITTYNSLEQLKQNHPTANGYF